MEDGLPNSAIKNIFQDQKGYIWVTTQKGVSKFDGKIFRTFGKADGINDSMNLEILCSSSDNKGNLWFGTSLGGLLKFDGIKFTQYTVKDGLLHNQVWSLYYDSLTQKLWIGTLNGINIFDGKKIQPFTHNADLPDLQVRAIVKNKNNEFWFGTFHKGLVKYSDNKLEIFSELNGHTLPTIIDLRINNGALWLSTKKTVYKYNGKTFSDLLEKANIPPETVLTSIAFDKAENIWIGTRDGLLKFDLKRVNRYTTEDGLAGNYINGLFRDDEGNIWAGSNEGLSVNRNSFFSIYDEKHGIEKGNVNCASTDKNNNLWLAVNGLGVLKLNGKKFDNVTENNGSLKNLSAKHILFDSRNKMWVSTLHQGILSSVDGAHFKKEIFDNNILSFENIRYMQTFEDSKKRFWFSTLGTGALLYDGKNTTRFHTPEICDNGINLISEDKEGTIWIATNAGISRCKNNAFTNYQSAALTDTICRTINFYGNNLVIGTNNGIMMIKNALTEGIKKTNIQKIRLNNENRNCNEITGTFIDKNNCLWIGTSFGLYKLNLIDYFKENKTELKYYGKPEGLKKLDFNSTFTEIDGNIFVGCGTSLIKFDPAKNSFNNVAPKLYINQVKLFLENVDWKKYADSLNGNLPVNLTLPYNLNHLQFNFIGLCYTNPTKVKYKYILEGFDNHWWPETDKTDIVYSNVPPGEYTFKVISCNNDNVWNKQASYFHFTINPPFWRTKWFLTSAILIILLAAGGFFKYKINHQKRLNKLLERTILLRTNQLFDEKNKLEKANIELKVAKDKAEESEKVKEKFLTNMSHEIRTPMNAVIGMSNLLLETGLEEKQKYYIESIRKSGDNLLVIINDILDFSKINAGKIELEKIPFKLEEIIENIKNIFEFSIDEKISLTFENQIKENLTLSGDPHRLNQIIINLVGNAVKFTKNGFVSVKTEVREKDNNTANVLFTISDSGIGIPDDKLEEIFQSFSQATGDITRKFGGTGLGLTITKQLVELMGGKISVKSVVNEGTSFFVELNFNIYRSSHIVAGADSFDSKKLTLERILIVEDHPFNQTVAADNLNILLPDSIVDVANNGQEGIDMLKKFKYDLILMDIQMPVMDGIEATRIIRLLQGEIKNTPIIAVTASATSDEVKKYAECGMDGYILKPFKQQDLKNIIIKYCRDASA